MRTPVLLADRLVNTEAVAIAPTVGWLLLACAICVACIFIAYSDHWRRWWLAAEDPRALAVFRIVFGVFVISNINDQWEYFEFLYTDEGIFTSDVARQVFARGQFAGFGDGMDPAEPWGFFDIAAFWEFLKGPKYSLLFFWDSPTFFWAHLIVFELCAALMIIGFRTRTMAVLTWFLMNSILTRNHLAWEGTEVVYRCFLAYLVLARSGHAYSVDNWLRCRRLRKQGRLSEPGKPGGGAGAAPCTEHPSGLEAIYRRIPVWPRRLMMLQLATIYITTGTLKTGSVWLAGDSLYYALNLDHFYRLPPQYLASLGGTHLFRGMTWAVKVGQTGFTMILVGLIARWMITENFPALSRARRWLARIAFVTLIGLTTAVVYVAWPVHHTPPIHPLGFSVVWIALWGGLWVLWRRLESRPFAIAGVGLWRFHTPMMVDRMWVGRWLLGRRVLLVWHLAFHAHIFVLMNVGQFQTAMLSATFVFIEGREIATMLRDIAHRLGRWGVPGCSRYAGPVAPIVPTESADLPKQHRDRQHLPRWSLVVALTIVVSGIIIDVGTDNAMVNWRWAWVAALVLLAGLTLRGMTRRTTVPAGGRSAIPWAYGPIGRLLVGGVIVFHLAGVATWLLPSKDCLSSFRGPARSSFTKWLTLSTTEQGWGMFAPNPPRTNVFLKVMVTDEHGETWDLRTDVYAAERKPIPWIWNTRLRKMNRRIIGGESGPSGWYRKWYARYECRRWAREHNGIAPKRVELVKMWYRIPTPEQTRRNGYYIAEELLERTGKERVSYTEHCNRAVMGQLPNFIRDRDGLPRLEPGTYKAWKKHKRRAWDRRKP